jgi:DNA modification methylase
MTRLQVQYHKTESLRPYQRNARTHSKKQVRQLADSIRKFGFTNPILITRDGGLIGGHGRLEAAKLLGMDQVPTIVLEDLSPDERRAYILADNKLALNAGWDTELLAIELAELSDLGLGELTGFSTTEIDITLDHARDADPAREEPSAEDVVVPLAEHAVTRRGELWRLGRHVLICGDARESADYEALTVGKPIDCVFTDPPYNCPVNGHVCGLGKTKHREFAMAAGEMSEQEFTQFLASTLGLAASRCKDGAIAFVCMDWRGMQSLLTAGQSAFTEQKQLCVWNKTNGGMGTFYRSKHELVFVYKVGTAPHTNNFGLGDTGRYRTNVWDYPGVSSLGSAREDHARHPTPKPVALVADALRDCTRRGELVLDPFAGSGTTLIAAEVCGRAARLIEFDPLYCDAIIRRFEQFTGQNAFLIHSDETFEDASESRFLEVRRDAR